MDMFTPCFPGSRDMGCQLGAKNFRNHCRSLLTWVAAREIFGAPQCLVGLRLYHLDHLA